MRRARPLRFYLMLFMMLMTSGVGLVIALLLYERGTELIAERALAQARSSAQEAGAELDRLLGPIRTSVQLLALVPGLNGGDWQSRLVALPGMAEALRSSPMAVTVYMGNDQGEFFELRRLQDTHDLEFFDAPIGSRFLLQSIEPEPGPDDGGRVHYRFLDEQLRPLEQRRVPGFTDFDPRQRPWYRLAKEKGWLVRTPPYRFYETGMIGSSVAMVSSNGQVVGADLSHSALDEWLRQRRHTQGAHMLIFDGGGRVVAGDSLDHSPYAKDDELLLGDIADPVIARLARLAPPAESGLVAVRQEVEGRTWQFYLQRLPVEEAEPLFLGTAIPLDELMNEAEALRNRALLVTLVALLLTGALAYWLANLVSRPIDRLARQAARIRYFEFDVDLDGNSHIREVQELAATLQQNRLTMQRFIDALKRLNDEPDFHRLLPTVLQVTVEVSQARGALLLIRSGEQERLEAVAGLWDGNVVEEGLGFCAGLFAAEAALQARQSLAGPGEAVACARFGLPACASFSVPLFNRHAEAPTRCRRGCWRWPTCSRR